MRSETYCDGRVSPIGTHRRDIDGLRAVAVLAVIVDHAAPGLLPGGFVGVDVFFVISGFLITSIVLRDLDAGTFSFATFYERRVRRLLPNLTILLLVCTGIAWLLLLPGDFRDYARSLLNTTRFTSNIYFWRDAWYFAAPAQTKPLIHTWSLAIEEQYYVVFPLTLWALKRYLPTRVNATCIMGFCGSLALSLWAAKHSQSAGFYLLPPRAWELLLGSLLVTAALPRIESRRTLETIAAAGLLAILVAAFAYDSSTLFPGGAALLPCVGAAMVIYAGSMPLATVTSGILGCRPLVFIGLMSYSLYLWHWPLLAFARYYFLSALTPVWTALVVAGSALLALLTWMLVERPVRLKALLGTRRRLLIAMGGCAACLALFGDATSRSGGAAMRFANVPVIDYDSVVDDIGRDKSGVCFLPAGAPLTWNASACTYTSGHQSAERTPRTLLLIGDSFAAQFSGWMRLNFPGTVVELTASACPPLFGFVPDVRPQWCSEINRMREEALRGHRFTDVFMGAWWGQTPNPGTMRALEETVHRILGAGVEHVTVLGTVPHFADSPIDIINRRRVRGLPALDTMPAIVYPEYRVTLDRISRLDGVRVLNVDDWVCRAGRCLIVRDGDLLFVDGAAHLTRVGAGTFMQHANWP